MSGIERIKEKSREQGTDAVYETIINMRKEFHEKQKSGKIVVRSEDREWELSRQGFVRWYLVPTRYKDNVLQDWYVFMLNIKKHSGRHRHQGGLVIFIVEGKGGTEVDGEFIEWEAGDLVLLPVKPGGIEHKHFNSDPNKACRWIAFVYFPLWDSVASEFTQLELSQEFVGEFGSRDDFIMDKVKNKSGSKYFEELYKDLKEPITEIDKGKQSFKSRREKLMSINFYGETMKLRDLQRSQMKNAIWLVKGKDLPWENNPHGVMRWYLHEAMDDTAVRTLNFYIQEIPKNSRSGKLRYQGNAVIYIIQGKGYTVMDGVKYEWKADDVIQLPLRRDGVIFQHFNSGDIPVRFVFCEPNLLHATMVDRGSGFDQIEISPDFDKDYIPGD